MYKDSFMGEATATRYIQHLAQEKQQQLHIYRRQRAASAETGWR